ncbi:NAD-dependent epimerase/dehydratase family protein [Jatrophihabitans telluris]|uniref:NAD-dependent epimerase/dehydratase family protein n=1 Tax=Jatrophihabitans telluris TaxID=2038343 RepID=UPI0024BFA312|nr:NAD-dependent epimerase/dehydratase family protein [Jatrophihabitans telluris]
MDSSRPSRVLVTGGAGFIGCALSQLLVDDGWQVTVLDSLHPQVHPTRTRPTALHAAAELVVADVTEPGTWASLFAERSFDLVIHLAAETGTGQSLDESSRHALVNVVGTTRMLDAMSQLGRLPEHVILSSSRAVYGEGRWQDETTGAVLYPGQRSHSQLAAGEWDFAGTRSLPSSAPTTEPRPTSVYGATKLAQEHILSAWCRSRSVDLTVLRMQNVYGPGQSLTNSYTGIVTLFSQLAREGKSIPLYEDGQVTRDFVFIDDVADAFARAWTSTSARGGVYDIGSGLSTTIEEMATELAQFHAAPAPTVTGKFRDGDVRHAATELTTTLTELDWKPTIGLAEGLAALQHWIEAAPGGDSR